MKKISLKNNNFVKLLRPYHNQWVALSLDGKKVIAKGKTPKEASTRAQKKGCFETILTLANDNYAYSVT